ncbi:MAG: alcohol dehydrogenase catalytic domain-containing protein [Lachnospiraceae bacterium]|jgi:L-iditol 2-dehydrogenase|nr:alcohol dehydrogenase catalytic domain-containing protein [Lachnospiraceae bacterium]
MKAVVFYGENDLRFQELPKPKTPAGGVLVKVKACSICGSDLRTIRHGHAAIKEPRVLGHETVGIIEELGEGVTEWKEGDRVAITPGIGCGVCASCRSGFQNMCYTRKTISQHYDGGFAEYVAVPYEALRAGNLNRIPQGVGFLEASLAEPLACVLNGQEDLQIRKGDVVAVIGAGSIGILHCMAAYAAGAAKVILLNRSGGRLREAERFGFDAYVDLSLQDGAEAVKELTEGRGADVVIVAAGAAEALTLGIQMAAKMGKVSMFAGLPKSSPEVLLNINELHYRQISLHGAFSSAPRHNKMALELIGSGKLKPQRLITHLVGLEKMTEGVEAAESRKALRAVISPCVEELLEETKQYDWIKTIS